MMEPGIEHWVIWQGYWIHTCQPHVGGGQEEGDGVGEDKGGCNVRPEDWGGTDEEGAGEVDQVKAGQRDH